MSVNTRTNRNPAVELKADMDLLILMQSRPAEASELVASVQLLDDGKVYVVKGERLFPLSIDAGGARDLDDREVVLDLGVFSYTQLIEAVREVTYTVIWRTSGTPSEAGRVRIDKASAKLSQMMAISHWLGWPSVLGN